MSDMSAVREGVGELDDDFQAVVMEIARARVENPSHWPEHVRAILRARLPSVALCKCGQSWEDHSCPGDGVEFSRSNLAKVLDDFADAEFALGQAEVNGTSQECEKRTRERDEAKAALLTELGHREGM